MIALKLFNSNKNKTDSNFKIISKDKTYIYQNSTFYQNTNKIADQAIAVLDFSDCLIDTIEVPLNVDSSDLSSIIELKTYEELALDPTQDYVIKFLPQKSSQSENGFRYFVFVAKEQDIAKKFTQRPIDFIGYAPLIIQALFTKNYLPDINDFAFAYLDDSDAFIAVYSSGSFVYCKGSQKLSLLNMYNKFCEIAGERIQNDEFIKFFLEGFLNLLRSDIEDTLSKFWTQFFTTISEILLHAKRTFKINEYAAVYIGTVYGAPMQIGEIANKYFSTKVMPFEFNLGQNSAEKVDIITRLAPIYHECENSIDFSIFHRPPPFLKRDGGKALTIIAVSGALAILYPLVMFGPYDAYLAYKISSVNSISQQNSVQKLQYTTQIAAIEHSLKQNEDTLKALKNEYDYSITALKDLVAIKTNYTPRAVTIVDLAKAINDSKVRLERLDINETNATLICITASPSNLSTLIKRLSKLYNEPPASPILINEKGLYRAELKLIKIGTLP